MTKTIPDAVDPAAATDADDPFAPVLDDVDPSAVVDAADPSALMTSALATQRPAGRVKFLKKGYQPCQSHRCGGTVHNHSTFHPGMQST